MKGFLRYIAGVVMTFLPPRYRKDIPLRGEAMVAGIAQLFAALGLLIVRFAHFSWQRALYLPEWTTDVPSNLPQVNATPGAGIFMMADFLFNPLNALLLYLTYEGLVRCLDAHDRNCTPGRARFGRLPNLQSCASD